MEMRIEEMSKEMETLSQAHTGLAQDKVRLCVKKINVMIMLLCRFPLSTCVFIAQPWSYLTNNIPFLIANTIYMYM